MMKNFRPHFNSHFPSSSSSSSSSSSTNWLDYGICSICGSKFLSCLLHYVRHNGLFRNLCTNCVLKNHAGLFCPICIQVFEPNNPPSPRHRQMCLNCPSISHISCVQSNSVSGFLCPSCSDPNFKFCNPSSTSSNIEDRHSNGDSNSGTFFDIEAAKAFVAAAEIAATLLTNAALAAKADAERKAEEAALAKKKAKEALEKLALIVGKENENENEKEKENKREKEKEPRGGSQKTKSKPSKNAVVVDRNGKGAKPAK